MPSSGSIRVLPPAMLAAALPAIAMAAGNPAASGKADPVIAARLTRRGCL